MNQIITNFHTHNHYCDGKEKPEAYVKSAIKLGFTALGFSSHAPVLVENDFSVPIEKLADYCAEIDHLRQVYKDQIEIFLGLEADFIPNLTYDFDFFRNNYPIDYLIGSVHLVTQAQSGGMWFIDGKKQALWDKGLKDVFGNDIQKGVAAFYHQTNQMIETQKTDILGHFDKIKMHNQYRFFTTQEAWYQKLVDESLELIKEKNTVMEINTRGLYKGRSDELFPSILIIQKANKMNIPMVLNTDAHHPDELYGFYAEAKRMIQQAGIKELWHFSKTGWYSTPLD